VNDIRRERLKNGKHLILFFIVIGFVFIFGMLKVYLAQDDDVLDRLGLLLVYFIFIISVICYIYQGGVAYDISLIEGGLESERVQREKEMECFERGLDLFYLPLLNLLTCCDGDVVDFVRLNEVNCHRYLAKSLVLSQFDVFCNECVRTKRLPVNLLGALLVTVNADIDFLNVELMKVSKDFLK